MSLTYVPVIPADRDITFSGDVTFSGTVTITGTTSVTDPITYTGAAATDVVLGSLVSGDTFDRFRILTDGDLEWGSGAGARDTNLYRSGANALTTDDLFAAVGVTSTTAGTTAAGTFSSSADGTATVGVVRVLPFSTAKRAFDVRLSADTVSRLRVDMSAGGSGTLVFGDGTSADTNLYRGAADVLMTDDTFRIGSAGTLQLGAAGDVNLYRTGADELATDSNFTINGTLDTTGYTVIATGQSSGVFSIFDGTAAALDFGTAGGGFAITEGANCRMGVATLVGGTVTVNNTSVTANTRVFVSRSTTGGTTGDLSTTQVAATSFTVNSSSGTDTSTVVWLLVEPS